MNIFGWFLFAVVVKVVCKMIAKFWVKFTINARRCPECGEGVVGFLGKCEMCGFDLCIEESEDK